MTDTGMNIDEILTIEASAHCDGPCGVYDPASARVAAEAVQSMTKKMMSLETPDPQSEQFVGYLNTMSRYASIKEEEAQICKDELLVLWTDFFKPQHLESIPDLHNTFWQAAKLCSACKVEVSVQHAQELMDAVESIHNMFWAAKGREVPWVRAS
jgi:nickel superoxide dismutase